MRPAVICGPLAREEPRASSELVAGPRVRDRRVAPAPHPGALESCHHTWSGRYSTPRRRLHGVGARAARNSAVTGQDASPGPERGASLRPAHFFGEHFGPQPWLQQLARAGRSQHVNFNDLLRMRLLTPTELPLRKSSPVVPGCCRTILER
jgi:hypothetical protein